MLVVHASNACSSLLLWKLLCFIVSVWESLRLRLVGNKCLHHYEYLVFQHGCSQEGINKWYKPLNLSAVINVSTSFFPRPSCLSLSLSGTSHLPLPMNLYYYNVLFIFHTKWITQALPKVFTGKISPTAFQETIQQPWWTLYSSHWAKVPVCWYHLLGFVLGWKCMPINVRVQLYMLLTSIILHFRTLFHMYSSID